MNKSKRTRKYERRLRQKWISMHNRCKYGKGNYGKLGIDVCDEWCGEEGFERFYDWSINNGFENDLVLDRENTYKSYSPDNCRWVTQLTNNQNKTNTVFVLVNGKRMPLTEYCRDSGEEPLKIYNRIYRRLRRGWTIDQALEVKA